MSALPVATDAPPSGTLSLRLRQMRYEAEQIVSYELVDAGDAPLPPFEPGAHLDLLLPGGLVRSYSLLNDSTEHDRYLIAVQRDLQSKGGSRWLHEVPRVGAVLQARAPSNDFPLREAASRSFLLAGGIGVTPLLAMVRRLNALARPWHLVYAARSRANAAFVPLLQRLAHEARGRFELWLDDERGGPIDVRSAMAEVPADADVYCCGPRGMIDAFIDAAASRPPQNVHYERFAAGAPAAAGGYTLVLARSGRRIEVPADRSMLDALTQSGVDVPYACSAGVCGTCRTPVLAGEPDHRDDYLTPEEKQRNDCVMVCCSGARSAELVLDL